MHPKRAMITWACVRLARWRHEPLTRATGCRLARPRASCGGSSPGSVCRLSSSTGPTGPPGPGRQDARGKGGEAEFKHKPAAVGGKRSGTAAAAARMLPPSFRIPACCKSFQSDPHLQRLPGVQAGCPALVGRRRQPRKLPRVASLPPLLLQDGRPESAAVPIPAT